MNDHIFRNVIRSTVVRSNLTLLCVAIASIAVLAQGFVSPSRSFAQTSPSSPGTSAPAPQDEPEDPPAPTPEPQPEPQTTDEPPTGEAAPATGAPAPQAASESEEDAEREESEPSPSNPQPLPWRNSFLSWTQGTTFNTFVRDGQQTYNPLYYWQLFLSPRWYLDATTYFLVNAGVSLEFTDDDSSAYNREPQLFDTSVELRKNILFEGFVFIPSLRVSLPTSKGSQAAQRYIQPGLGLSIVRPFPELAGLTLAATGRYQRWIAGSNVALTRGAYPCAVGGAGGSSQLCDQAAGGTAGADQVLAGLTVSLTPFAGLSVFAQGLYFGQQGFGLADGTIPVGNGQTVVIPDNSPTHWRHFTYMYLGVGYDVITWLNVSLGVANSTNLAPLFNTDGSVRSPFNPDAQVNLNLTFQLDGIYQELSTGGESNLTPQERQRRRQGLANRAANSMQF